MTTPTDEARELTVAEIEAFRKGQKVFVSPMYHDSIDAICDLATKGIEAEARRLPTRHYEHGAKVTGMTLRFKSGDEEHYEADDFGKIIIPRLEPCPSPPSSEDTGKDSLGLPIVREEVSGPAVVALANRKDDHCPICCRPWSEGCSILSCKFSSASDDVERLVEALQKAATVHAEHSPYRPRRPEDCLEWKAADLIRSLVEERDQWKRGFESMEQTAIKEERKRANAQSQLSAAKSENEKLRNAIEGSLMAKSLQEKYDILSAALQDNQTHNRKGETE